MSDTRATIREAVIDDLPACAAIINDYIDDTEWLPRVISREEIENLFTAKLLEMRVLLIADVDGEVGGYLSMDKDNGKVSAIYLAPGFRCNGTGKSLIDAAKKRKPDGLNLTVFEPNVHAKRFYEREGFAEAPEERDENTEEGVPTLMMRWEGAAA